MESESKAQRYLKSPALWTILFILTGGYFLATWVNSIGGPEAVGEKFGVLAPVITGASLFILTPTPFPTDLIAIAHGALYGFVAAALLIWIVLWRAVFLEASIGRRLGVPMARIAWCSAIGIIPGATALAAAGAGFLQL